MRSTPLLGLLLLSLISLPSILGQTPTWSHLFRIDCDGTYEIAPTIGIGAKVPIFRNIYNEVLQTFFGRAQCLCPSATRDDFDLLFEPVTAMLNNIKASPNPWDQCLMENLPRNFDQLTLFRMDLPSTCSLQTWASAGTCAFQHSFPRINADLQFALSKCPNSFFPSLSLTCAGDGCSTLGRPCASNADCKGLTCFDLEGHLNITDPTVIPDALFEALQEVLVYGANDASPGCYQAKRGTSAKTPENDIMTNLLSFLAKNFFTASSNYNKLQFCGVLEVLNFTSDDFTLNDTAIAGAEAHLDVIPSFTTSCVSELFSDEASSPGSDLENFNETTRIQITIPGLKPWDGKESGGVSAFTRPNVIPTFKKIPDRTVLAIYTCEQNLILETHNVGFLLSQRLQSAFPHMTSLLKDLIACRSNPADNDLSRFLVRYGLWAPLYWLGLIDEGSATFPLPAGQQDWRSIFDETSLKVKGLPSSCNFYRFLETGTCEFDFLGLKTLLLADITIRVTLKSCGSSSAFSSYTVECLGEDCGFLSGLNPCDTNSQCSSGLTCTPLPKLISSTANEITTPPSSLDYFDHLLFNETLLSDFLLKTDFFGLFFSNKFNGNLCSNPSFFEGASDPKVNITDYLGKYPQEQCFGPNQWSADLQRILVNVFGAETPNTNIQSKLQFCMPGLSVFNPETIKNWAMTLVTVEGPTVTLNSNIFKAVAAPTPTPTPTSDPTTTSAASKLGALSGFLIGSVLGALLLMF